MSLKQAPAQTKSSREQQNATDARLHGHWLLLMRVGWVVVYAGCIVGLQALLRGFFHQTSAIAIVVSTLVIAALFQPLGKRIQAGIDRRFYRRKYDAARTLAAFSATLHQEVDLNQLREQLLAVVQETMQPAHVSLWLRPPAPARKDQATWISTPPAREHGEKS